MAVLYQRNANKEAYHAKPQSMPNLHYSWFINKNAVYFAHIYKDHHTTLFFNVFSKDILLNKDMHFQIFEGYQDEL
mgnify:CR=1 FL=1